MKPGGGTVGKALKSYQQHSSAGDGKNSAPYRAPNTDRDGSYRVIGVESSLVVFERERREGDELCIARGELLLWPSSTSPLTNSDPFSPHPTLTAPPATTQHAPFITTSMSCSPRVYKAWNQAGAADEHLEPGPQESRQRDGGGHDNEQVDLLA